MSKKNRPQKPKVPRLVPPHIKDTGTKIHKSKKYEVDRSDVFIAECVKCKRVFEEEEICPNTGLCYDCMQKKN